MIKDIVLPEISETVESGDVIEIFVKVGDVIEAEQPLVQLETDKATFDVPSPTAGKVVEVLIETGQKVDVGQAIFKVDTDGDQKQTPPQEEKKEPEKKDAAPPPKPAPKAEEKPVDKPAETKTPPAPAKPSAAPAKAPTPGAKALPDFSAWGAVERKPVSATRKTIAETLTYTWATVPQVTQFADADITRLEEFRKSYAEPVKAAGGKLTVTGIALKAVAMALRELPDFNATFDPQANEIIYKQYCHVSVAVDTDRGLLVPTLRDVDKKSLRQISVELSAMAEKARQRKVTPEDMVGGNFTVTNLGGLGGGHFSPILFWPQTGILGISRAERRPVYVGDTLQPRLMLPLSLSYDHRIIDGAAGVRFIRRIVEILEDPFVLALHENVEQE